MCIDGIESMDVAHIANTLNIFFRRYFLFTPLWCLCHMLTIQYSVSFSGNFNIPINSTKESVFWCTKEAVFQLMKEKGSGPPFQVYPAMLWSKLERKSVVVV